jgi:putative ABC transport system permease protein
VLQDFRFALRLLNRHRGYAILAVLTVALGVGANTAVFSIADSVLFRPLPFQESERLFILRIGDIKTKQTYGFLPVTAIDAARTSGVFDRIEGAEPREARVYVKGEIGLDLLSVTPVSREYLDLLGVRPLLGRLFDASDVGTRAVLLSHRAWMRQYGGDPSVVGGTVPAAIRTMDASGLPDQAFRIVGVLPPRLRLPLATAADGLTLMEATPATATMAPFTPLVRLRPGITVAAAEAQLGGVQGEELVPGKTALRLVPLREEMAARQDPVLWLLLASAAIVLLVACVNLANLILARGSARSRELAVRVALGGTRRRIVRLLLVEGLCIALLGTAAGLLAAYAGFRVLADRLPPLLARVTDPAFDVRALAFAIVIATIAAATFSVLPALRLSRTDAKEGLRLGQLQSHAPRRGRSVLVGIEVAICLTLLVGAGLVGRTLFTLLSQDLGFASRRLVATFDLPTLVVRRGTELRIDTAARGAFYQARLREVREAPGVHAAGVALAAPFSTIAPDSRLREGSPEQAGGIYRVSSGYFPALGMPLLAGRDFTDHESFSDAPVGVLNETAARSICGTPSACLGRVVHPPRQSARTIVGVVADARRSARRGAIATMYVPFDAARFSLASLVIDASDSAATRDALQRVLSASPHARVVLRSLDDARELEIAPYRFNALVVGAFGMLTLALAIVGVYGVMSAVVSERTREYGIRLALGATRARVNGHVLRCAAAPVVCGIAGGTVLALWGGRFVSSLLFGVVPIDLMSFAVAGGVILAACLLAAWIPARRAARIDPIVALKAE